VYRSIVADPFPQSLATEHWYRPMSFSITPGITRVGVFMSASVVPLRVQLMLIFGSFILYEEFIEHNKMTLSPKYTGMFFEEFTVTCLIPVVTTL